MRTLVVGDVHGCRQELEDLLKAADYTTDDRLVLVGDLVAKGPDSQGVVQLAREKSALGVLGNHDAHVLNILAGKHGSEHHHKVAKSLTSADIEYLDRLPLWLDFAELNALVVHAGLLLRTPLLDQPRDWVINLRSLDLQGNPSKRVGSGVPWASRWPGPRFVYFGHDAIRGLQKHRHAWGLDTGCVYGKQLTAVWLPEQRLVSVPARRAWVKVDGE